MSDAGFRDAVTQLAERIQETFVGEAVLGDPFLERSSKSQLLMISEPDYLNGKRAVCATIEQGKHRGLAPKFPVELTLFGTGREAQHPPN